MTNGWEAKDIDETFLDIDNQFAQAQPVIADIAQNPNVSAGEAHHNGKAIAALVLGIIGLIAWFIPIIGVPVTIIALILGIKGLKSLKRGMAIAAIVLSIIGLLASIVNASIGAYMGATGEYPFVNNFFGQSQQEEQVQQIQRETETEETAQTPTAQRPTVSSHLESQPYSNPSVGFKINYPKGWRIDKSGQFGIHVLFLNIETDQEAGNPFKANVNVISGPSQGLDLAGYVEANKELLPKLLQDYKLIEDKKVTTSKGLSAYLIGGTHTQGVFKLRNLQLMIISGGNAYVVTGTALESTWGQYKNVIEESLLSFDL